MRSILSLWLLVACASSAEQAQEVAVKGVRTVSTDASAYWDLACPADQAYLAKPAWLARRDAEIQADPKRYATDLSLVKDLEVEVGEVRMNAEGTRASVFLTVGTEGVEAGSAIEVAYEGGRWCLPTHWELTDQITSWGEQQKKASELVLEWDFLGALVLYDEVVAGQRAVAAQVLPDSAAGKALAPLQATIVETREVAARMAKLQIAPGWLRLSEGDGAMRQVTADSDFPAQGPRPVFTFFCTGDGVKAVLSTKEVIHAAAGRMAITAEVPGMMETAPIWTTRAGDGATLLLDDPEVWLALMEQHPEKVVTLGVGRQRGTRLVSAAYRIPMSSGPVVAPAVREMCVRK